MTLFCVFVMVLLDSLSTFFFSISYSDPGNLVVISVVFLNLLLRSGGNQMAKGALPNLFTLL